MSLALPKSVGFAAGVVGDFSFKLGDNYHAGNSMIALKNDGQKDANGSVDPYDQWTRGGGYVKARASNTTLTYGTQILDLPVLASMTTRNVPEYFEGTLITSHEIKNLEVVAGKFTKNQLPEHIASDQNHLDRAYVWGAKYQFNDQLKAAYYGADLKDKLERHYANVNYKQTLANKDSLTYDFSGYHTKFEPGTTYSATGPANEDKKNNIWAVSATYNTYHIQLCWRINKIQAMLAMTMVKMAMVVKVFICQTHTCLTLLVIMKSRYNCNTLMTLRI